MCVSVSVRRKFNVVVSVVTLLVYLFVIDYYGLHCVITASVSHIKIIPIFLQYDSFFVCPFQLPVSASKPVNAVYCDEH